VTEVARRNGVAASLVFTWRRQARTAERVVPCFAPVADFCGVETGEENSSLRPKMTDGCGSYRPPERTDRDRSWQPATHRVDAHVDPEALERVLDVLDADDCHTG